MIRLMIYNLPSGGPGHKPERVGPAIRLLSGELPYPGLADGSVSLKENIMKSPFPGMDPYIEACGLWGDFHSHLIEKISEKLVDAAPENYLVRTGERSYAARNRRVMPVKLSCCTFSLLTLKRTGNGDTDSGRDEHDG
jgi:hypothetical protein